MNLKCPHCSKELLKDNKTYVCENRHSFDIAKEGYANMLLKQGHKEYGDSKAMCLARREFFKHDYYASLKNKLSSLVKELNIKSMIDAGCGEGYYTNFIKANNDVDILAFDISKEMVRLASKGSDVTYVVANNLNIPVFDNSVDAILNCFVPRATEEYTRVLKDGGYLIVVNPHKYHLFELKQAVYDNPYTNELKYESHKSLELVKEYEVNDLIHLKTVEEIKELFEMTPYVNKTSLKDKAKLDSLSSLDVRTSFHVAVYKKIAE